ncbi:uncharacterized protein LOC143117688 [Alosa pseudoharengus]|uniref:uncharacterized protein LOC143117688 n=1 Tax=Alosa pseudoharengus TaxID=34774 RepID=UPI003F8895C3
MTVQTSSKKGIFMALHTLKMVGHLVKKKTHFLLFASRTVIVLVFALGHVGFATADDPCEQYTNISDPWRNRGFLSTSSQLQLKDDSDLQEGWYRFVGVGGDILDFASIPIPSLAEERLGYCSLRSYSPTVTNVNLCAGAISNGSVDVKVCSSRYYVHKLRPTASNQIYATSHQRCTESSCGEFSQCGTLGACVCKTGYEMPKGLLLTGDTYGCTDPCEQYTNISDPWRNRGFLSTSSQLQLKDDSDLQEGWYRFVGVGGDILDFASIPIPSLAEQHLGYCSLRSYSPTVTNVNLCAGAISNGSVDVKVCSSRYYVHKLRPTASNQIYATSHQRCTESSCGEFAQCGTLGACVCKTGYEMPKGLLPTGDTYGCKDPCEQYTNISDPWRNRGFLSTSSQLQLKDDSDLQEGWYRFVGVGGDILDFASIPIPSLAEEHLGYCSLRSYSPTVTNVNLCAGAISNGSVDVKVCSSRYYVHKLRPTASNQIYATSHQRCTESSCGEFAQCGTLGACVCKTGYEMPKGLLPTGDTYGCKDPCEQYTNISDPWRNRGFLSTSSQLQLKDDSDLQEGWYRFVGVGGDILDFASIPIPSLAEQHLGYCSLRSYSPTVTNVNLCAGAISNGSVDVKVCSSRYYVHKLRPTASNQIYATSHQRCTESSCGEFAQCGTLGACVCKTGYEMPKGLLPTGDTYGCTDPCEQYTNISDPWRNRGFLSTSSQLQLKDDSDLQEGWYRFVGVGGDILDFASIPIPSLAEQHLGYCSLRSYSPTVTNVNLCAGAISNGSVDVKVCSSRYYVHKLRPTASNQIYATSHQRCTESSCGEFAQCGTLGACVCKTGYEMPKGLLPTGDTYGCRDTDECALAGSCGVGADCVKSPGSYHCECVSGYLPHLFPNNTLTCTDQQVLEAECKVQLSECIINDMTRMINSIKELNLPPSDVAPILVKLLASLYDLSRDKSVKTDTLIQHINSVLRSSEEVMDILMPANVKMRSHSHITTSLADLQQITIGPGANPRPVAIQIKADDTQLEIDLSKNNADKISASLQVFTNMEEVLTADFFLRTGSDNVSTVMSKVVSVTLRPTTQLSSPVNLTLKHTNVVHPQGVLSCVYWNGSAWVVDGCDVTQTNATHTVCTCQHLSTFTLIMQVERNWPKMAAMIIGLIFLILTLVTFALCALNPKVTNLARLNLCISLFQAHLLSLLVQELILHILPHKVLCRVLSGLQMFLYLSGFLWMHLDTLLLLLSIMMLKKLKKPWGEGPNCGHLSLIGYMLPLVIVGVVAGLMPDGYGTEWCGVRTYDSLSWSLLGPAYFTFTVNLILLFTVFISLCLLSSSSSLSEEIRNVRCQAVRVLVQSVVITSPWVLGFFHMGYGSVVDLVFLILTSQQGTFIFLIHCVLNPEVQSCWKRFFQKLASTSPTLLNNM